MEDSKKTRAMRLRLEGFSYKRIGNQLGISAQRAYQLTQPAREIRVLVATRAEQKCQGCGIELGFSGDVHHKRVNGKPEEDYSDIDHLEYLCRGCHRREHLGEH